MATMMTKRIAVTAPAMAPVLPPFVESFVPGEDVPPVGMCDDVTGMVGSSTKKSKILGYFIKETA